MPKNVHEVRSFLGMANYNCKYIPDYATISAPLRELTKKNAHFQWKAEHEEAFQKMKNALTSVPVMANFDTKKDIVITVDASPVGISAILARKSLAMMTAALLLMPAEHCLQLKNVIHRQKRRH